MNKLIPHLRTSADLLPFRITNHFNKRSVMGFVNQPVDHPTQLTQVEFISERGRRNLLLRCHCPSDTGLPPSLIIKKVKTNSYNLDNRAILNIKFMEE